MGRIYEDVRKSILKETAAILAQVGKEPAKKKASKISSLAQGIEALQKEQDRVLPPVQGAAPGNEAGNAQHRIPHANDHADALSLLQNCWRNVISILLDTYRSSALPEEFHELIRRYFFLLQDMIRKAATPVIESPVLTEHEEKLAQLDAFVFWLERRPQYDFLACSERDGPSPIKGALNPTKHKKVERLLENARDIIQIEKNKPNPDVRTAAKGISHLFLRASKLPEVQSDRTRFFSIVGESRTAKHMDRLSHELDAALKLTTLPWAETTARPNDAQELLSPDETQAINKLFVEGANAISLWWRVGEDYERHAAAQSLTKLSINQKNTLIIVEELIRLQQNFGLNHNYFLVVQNTMEYLLGKFEEIARNQAQQAGAGVGAPLRVAV